MSKEITKYDVVFGTSLSDLNIEVKHKIKKGWQPHGGIVVDPSRFYQAIVQYEEQEVIMEESCEKKNGNK